jgi:hypothetical protein
MTVEDLIEALREMPPTARVEVEVATVESMNGDRKRLEESDLFDVLTVVYDKGVVTLALDEDTDD